MPQTNITYDAPYNRSLISKLDKVQDEKWAKAYPAFHPTALGYRLGTFHGEAPRMVGGGSSPLKYNPAGNSPAYPPMVLSSGLAVSSGGSFHQGARYAGVDGAIGALHHPAEGGRFNFFKALGSVARKAAKPLARIGESVAEKAALGAVGLGRKKGGRKGKAVGALSAVPAMPSKSGAGEGGVACGGDSSGGARSRSARAEIVKKVMKEKGMKMIEASKYVKAHNLY
jgi:hypothetical protein